MKNTKLWPWIPIIGVGLVVTHLNADYNFRNPLVFWGSLLWQILWTSGPLYITLF